MQLTTVFFALSGLAFAAAAPQALVPRDQIKDTLYVTFWQNGCYDTGSGTQSTFYVNEHDGLSKPGDCIINRHTDWQSVQIRQPSNTKLKYSVEFFSGEGCNNPISTFSENGCYTQPEGTQVITFKAKLL